MIKRVDPLTVECPSCGAPAGERCWSGTRRGRRLQRGSHRDRERAAAGDLVAGSFQTFLRRELRRVTEEIAAKMKRKT